MHARVTRLEGTADQMEQGIEHIRSTILPAARELDGFAGIISLADREGGTGLTITLWETEEALRASEATADRLRDQAAQAMGGTVAGVDRYEVTVSELTAHATV